ncbi:MAG: hypothetical protein DHS20C19_01720 [Acidimicrobiales bacterium]|nr:MAG: hypothetical protein DHS20C19_01720 [Acidimicrobiales bacterium]
MSFFYPIESTLRRPDERSGRDDRLVRRFNTGGRLHIHLRLGGADATRSRPIAAEVINLSITGGLVRFPATLRLKPGATVTLGNPPSTVVCRVVHTAMISTDHQDLGLEFVEPTDDFCADVSRAVAALRRDRGHVLAAWHRPN